MSEKYNDDSTEDNSNNVSTGDILNELDTLLDAHELVSNYFSVDNSTVPWLSAREVSVDALMTLAIIVVMISKKYLNSNDPMMFVTSIFCVMASWGGSAYIRNAIQNNDIAILLGASLKRVRNMQDGLCYGDNRDRNAIITVYMRAVRSMPFTMTYLVPSKQIPLFDDDHESLFDEPIITQALYECWWLPKLACTKNDYGIDAEYARAAMSAALDDDGDNNNTQCMMIGDAEARLLRELVDVSEEYCECVGARIRSVHMPDSVDPVYLKCDAPATLIRELGAQFADVATPNEPPTSATRNAEVRRQIQHIQKSKLCTCPDCSNRQRKSTRIK